MREPLSGGSRSLIRSKGRENCLGLAHLELSGRFHVDLRGDAVIHDDREALAAHAHSEARCIHFEAQRFGIVAITIRKHDDIVAYTAVTGTRVFARVRSWPHMRRTFRIGYGARLLVSIIFPIGVYLDLLCGVLSTAVVERRAGSEPTSSSVSANAEIAPAASLGR